MREGWTYKKLGSVATFVNGYPFKPTEWNDTGRRIIRIQNLNNLNAPYNLFKDDIEPKYIVHQGDVLISWSGTLGVYEWEEDEALLNQHIFKVIFDKTPINKQFFKYAVSSRINEMKGKVHGITMQHITKGEFDKTQIPVPPLPEQERIVAELDLLTGIIDKQKAQLQELDTLAQSIFYDMFGDPVENEKGWEMYEIASVCDDLFAGGDKPKDFSEEKDDDYKYPIIGNGDGERGILGYSKSYRVGKAAVTIGARGASIGNCRICEPHFTPVVRLITLVPNKRVNLGYLYAISRKISFNVNGAGQAQLTTPNVANKLIPVPPRELQDSFAQKIQSIESQKASINRSIAETQKLFDYTMDKYFG